MKRFEHIFEPSPNELAGGMVTAVLEMGLKKTLRVPTLHKYKKKVLFTNHSVRSLAVP